MVLTVLYETSAFQSVKVELEREIKKAVPLDDKTL